MPLSAEYRAYLGELFSCIGPIRIQRAFGLDALMAQEVMFGLVLDERIYLRTDAASRPNYEREGGRPFAFDKRNTRVVTSYLTMPDRLYDEPDELREWAHHDLAAALNSPTARKKRERRARAQARAPRKRRT